MNIEKEITIKIWSTLCENADEDYDEYTTHENSIGFKNNFLSFITTDGTILSYNMDSIFKYEISYKG